MPPPRPRRKARAKKKAEDSGKQEKLMEEAKHDPKWFSSCRKLEEPALFQVEGTSEFCRPKLLKTHPFAAIGVPHFAAVAIRKCVLVL